MHLEIADLNAYVAEHISIQRLLMAKNDQEEAFDKILSANLQRVIEFLKYAEAKNGALLTLASVWGLAIINILAPERSISIPYRAALSLSLPFILVAVLIAIWSFSPRMHLPGFLGGRRAGPHPPNLLFFGDLRKLTVAEVEQQLKARYLPPEEHTTTDDYVHALAVQISVNSQIVRRKLVRFSWGLAFMVLAVLLPLGRLAWPSIVTVMPWR